VAITVDSPPALETAPQAPPRQPAPAPEQPAPAPEWQSAPERQPAPRPRDPRPQRTEHGAAAPERDLRGPVAAALLAALTVYLAFNAGGFFPNTTAYAALATCVALALALVAVPRPFAGFTPGLLVPLGLLAGFAAWTLASGLWSDAPWHGLAEFDRALLYLLAFALFGVLAPAERRLAWGLRGLAVAAVAVCAVAWTTRVAADVWPIAANIHPERLSFPLTYWNALGLLATLGTLACVYLSSGGREPVAWRVAGAAAIPLLGSTLLLTFSRGSLAVAFLGLVVYLLLGRARRLLPTFAAVALPAAVALLASYQASIVSSGRFASSAGVSEGHRLALVVLACAVVAGLLRLLLTKADAALERWEPPVLERRRAIAALAVVTLAFVALLALFQVPARVGHQYDSFVEGNVVNSSSDARSRLTSGGNNGRIAEWEVAIEAFEAQPLHGTGAGTYQFQWDRNRSEDFAVIDAHSLYLEVLGELGAVGLLLLAGSLGAILIGLMRRLGGPERQAYAAAVALFAAWAVHAGIDWDWEMPAVTIWLFALAGLGLSRSLRPDRAGAPVAGRSGRLPRLLAVACVAALALAPAAVALSQSRLDTALGEFEADDCAAAVAAANRSLDVVGFRSDPHLVLGYCDARLGLDAKAAASMEDAVERDPENWRTHYGLALVLAIAGRDPLPELREAQRLNPFERKVSKLVRAMEGGGPEQWRSQAQAAALAL
jgi:O-antigen ligase